MATLNKQPKNGAPPQARKRAYERTTPLGRARKRALRMATIGGFVLDRLSSWEADVPKELGLRRAIAYVSQAVEAASAAVKQLEVLEQAGFVPPKKPSAARFEEGDRVRIVKKHAGRYQPLYGGKAITDLVVAKVLPSGAIAVKHKAGTPFIVPRSHLGRATE